MTQPKFINDKDETTFAPFVLIDGRHKPWEDVRLQFNKWDWLNETLGGSEIDGYYLNGYGIQGLVLATRISSGLEPCPDGTDPNSEGDTCLIHFPTLELAVETASLAQQMLSSAENVSSAIKVAREHGLDDG